jgi:hypothetical protein
MVGTFDRCLNAARLGEENLDSISHHAEVGTGLDSRPFGSLSGLSGIRMSGVVLVLSIRAKGGRAVGVAGWPSAVSVPATGATRVPELH